MIKRKKNKKFSYIFSISWVHPLAFLNYSLELTIDCQRSCWFDGKAEAIVFVKRDVIILCFDLTEIVIRMSHKLIN